MDAIWESKLDNRFNCKVVRVDQSNGTLTVVDGTDDSVLLCSPVVLSYGAQFGPDVVDVSLWQDMCIRAVDALTA